MNPEAMVPYGRALLAFHRGNETAQIVLRRDDGWESGLFANHFFRPPLEFSAIEVAALERCRGRVLDIGAGAGIHSLFLQSRGLSVTALDINEDAVAIMAASGVVNVHCGDVFRFRNELFDTLLLLGHGIGMAESLHGLSRFLSHARGLVNDGGQVLLSSVDVRHTDDPRHLAYHEANRRRGRYIGEIRMQCEYDGERGPYYGWLHVDSTTLAQYALEGWQCGTICEEDTGEYLAQLIAA